MATNYFCTNTKTNELAAYPYRCRNRSLLFNLFKTCFFGGRNNYSFLEGESCKSKFYKKGATLASQRVSECPACSILNQKNISDFLDKEALTFQLDLSSYDPQKAVINSCESFTCLLPDLYKIINLPYFWGRMTHNEATELLKDASDGSFILRESAQPSHLFSVSYRRFSKTLHTRLETIIHDSYIKYTFNVEDTNSHKASTVAGLLSQFSEPSLCMIYEPMCSKPVFRKQPFTLQEICRGRICSTLSDLIESSKDENLKTGFAAVMSKLRSMTAKPLHTKANVQVQARALSLLESLPVPLNLVCYLKYYVLKFDPSQLSLSNDNQASTISNKDLQRLS